MNSVDKTKLSCYIHYQRAPQFLKNGIPFIIFKKFAAGIECFRSVTGQSQVRGPSRLNTAETGIADSPSHKFTSALNTHTSVLNITDDSVDTSPLQLANVSEDMKGDVQISRKDSWSSEGESSDESSASDRESDSGSAASSSEGRKELKIHPGKGKTLPGLRFYFSLRHLFFPFCL